jgi:predicted metal-dependent hydrolase
MVGVEEIEKNDFNLNIPRFIDSNQPEDIQDIEAHLRGGIPVADIDALASYWSVCPQLRQTLFRDNRPSYVDLAVDKDAIKSTIYQHPEFVTFMKSMTTLFAKWRKEAAAALKSLRPGCHPKEIIAQLSEHLLYHYASKPLIDQYDVYQHLMDYWAETMQDDCYLIADDRVEGGTRTPTPEERQGSEEQRVDLRSCCSQVTDRRPLLRRRASGDQQILDQEREPPREYLDRESHYVWGKRYLLKVIEKDAAPAIELRLSQLVLQFRPGIGEGRKQAILDEWYRAQLKAAPLLIAKWEPLMHVKVERFFVQRMKTKWASCSAASAGIRLNTDLAKKPRECLEYLVVHEMVHLSEPTHNSRFLALMDGFMPSWRLIRQALNRLPVRHETWGY